MAVISEVVLIKGQVGGEEWWEWTVATGIQLEKTPRGTPSSSHMPNKSPHQITENKAKMSRRFYGYMLSY